ncbi:MAG: Hsp20/alpha crystallin family protein [bacterium]|nr:Hsp20/alpha crystallin family protein [bacterium]
MPRQKAPIPFVDDVSWVDLVNAERGVEPNTLYQEEGELAVDVYQTDDSVMVVALVAGVDPHDLSITVQSDLVTIRGMRREPYMEAAALHSECFWGAFSRTIVLPHDVVESSAIAKLSRGMLTITLAKMTSQQRVAITDEDGEE